MIRRLVRRLTSHPELLPIAGLALITTALWLVWLPAGIAAAGASLLFLEWRFDDDDD